MLRIERNANTGAHVMTAHREVARGGECFVERGVCIAAQEYEKLIAAKSTDDRSVAECGRKLF